MSLYDDLGGKAAIAAAVDLFYVKVLADPLLSPWFEHTDMTKLKRHQQRFLTVALGGNAQPFPPAAMAKAHASLGITDEAFDHVATHLQETLLDLGVSTELVGEVISLVAPLRSEIVTA